MKIAIVGYGIEGRANYLYYAAQGGYDMTIVDKRQSVEGLPDGIPTILGANALEQLQDFDLVVRSSEMSSQQIHTNGKIWSAANEFMARCPAQIIGVTGTKGKSTTCSLIAAMLRSAGCNVHIIGGTDTSPLDTLASIHPDDLVVYELHSFQLQDLEKSPHVALILPVEGNHLDTFGSADEYARSLANIRLHQTLDDICFYDPDSPYAQQIVDLPGAKTQNTIEQRDWRWRAFRYNSPEIRDPNVPVCYLQNQVFCIKRADMDELTTITANLLSLPGGHNLKNACAAIDVALFYGVDDASIKQALSDFTGLPHRLQRIRNIHDIAYYDDSSATTPGSTIAAIQAFDRPKIIICGGISNGQDFSGLAQSASVSNVRIVVAIGDTAGTIETVMRDHNIIVFNVGKNVTMAEIFAVVQSQVKEGDMVLLSPACLVTDMFSSNDECGEQFIAAANAL